MTTHPALDALAATIDGDHDTATRVLDQLDHAGLLDVRQHLTALAGLVDTARANRRREIEGRRG